MATFCLAIAQVTDFVLTVWLSPFLFVLSLKYMTTALQLSGWNLESNMVAGNLNKTEVVPMLIEFVALFFFSYYMFVVQGSKRDIL